MAHAQSGANRARRKKILKMAKGYRGRSKNCITVARQKVEKGLQYAYRDRRTKKRNFRALWIQRINAGVREHGMVYSQFMGGLIKAGVEIDRKVLSELAISEPKAFKALVDASKDALKKAA
jgi:large subunit ribosomal protein L20